MLYACLGCVVIYFTCQVLAFHLANATPNVTVGI